MHPFPFEDLDREKGVELLKKKALGEVLFSQGTYQVEVVDEESFWPFLQVSDEGELKDGFCTCETYDEKRSCSHLAASYLMIMRDEKAPLHLRFQDSLFCFLCKMASRRHGYEPDAIHVKEEGVFEAKSLSGKELFSLKLKSETGKKILNDLLYNRPVETEETSLKFSNLPADELEAWREGRPSESLKFELSFWADLAKQLILWVEQKQNYKVEFSKEELPKRICITFPDLELVFYIARVNWPELIPTLCSVNSPLEVREMEECAIEKITYDKEAKKFQILSKNFEGLPKGKEGIQVGDYLYHPGVGFFMQPSDDLLTKKEIPQNLIAETLLRHAPIIERHLQGTKITSSKRKARYSLYIDDEGSLHVKLYLFSPEDFDLPTSCYYGPWVYIENRGFFLTEEQLFEAEKRVVPWDKVGEFVTRHRQWLSEFEGFGIFLIGVESELSYLIDEEGSLRFTGDVHEKESGAVDYGAWLYIRGRGFYAKKGERRTSIVRPGLVIEREEVSHFIHEQRDDLESVERFFSNHCPVEKSGLEIGFNDAGNIHIEPTYLLLPEYKNRKVDFFEEFAYVKGEGFSEMPSGIRLPADYQSARSIDPKEQKAFLHYDLDQIIPFALEVDRKLQKPQRISLKIYSLSRARGEGEWQVGLRYETNLGGLDLFAIWEGIKEKKAFLLTDAGLINLAHPRYNWLHTLKKRRFSRDRKKVRLTTLEWIRLTAFEEIQKPIGKGEAEKKLLKNLEKISSFKTRIKPDITGLKSTLRPYQTVGVNWLFSLYYHGISAMLCDEMGLGKTHQAMALMSAIKNREAEAKILVVCPTSVIYHWEELLKNFLPGIRTLVYYGVTRSLRGFEENYDLILTSYGTLRSEKETFPGMHFELAVFDELQIAKNKQSQTHRALRRLDAKMRVGLTGTPIENRLLELKSLFDIILPGFMPTDQIFKELFIKPIEQHQDKGKEKLLSRLINPFILRRKKDEVLQDLPERIEEISYCDLSDEQHRLYEETYLQSRDMISHEMEEDKVPYMHIFAMLTRLKQICDHPALISKDPREYERYKSGKWELFTELLAEALESGQKVVVFTQFVDMAVIIENHLKKKNIGFAGIRGATRDRKAQLHKFRDDPECRVFVGTLQAAGTGIDLISASVLIHYDRWWNPAKEEQATARVHRIGQRRGVQVFKLVTKKSVEEHIHNIIEKKKKLQRIVGFDDENSIKTLSESELTDLMRELGRDLSS
ncbi:MAG: DEAD/DEAH box helicase [Candidatus Algichlamydia australiensis]|nr:DEAD/DEAH box helicase [Chlamydiales bacterium]